MRATSVIFLGALAGTGFAQPGRLMTASGDLANGVTVTFTCMAEPPLESSNRQLKISLTGVQDGPDRIHRFLVDEASRSYFGYDVMAAPTDGNHYLVTILPLQLPAGNLPGRTAGISPRLPPPQIIQRGDTMAIDLLVSDDGQQKIVDYLQVATRQRPRAPNPVTGPIKDYSIDDGPVKFTVSGEHDIFINGQMQSGAGLTGKSGSTMWFYFPGLSRYVLSLTPRAGYGFEEAGTIQDNIIRFRADGNRYEIRFPEALVGGGWGYRLYVLRDPEYRPANGAERMILGGIDRLENLVTR